jgi:hypothetical protein
MPIERYERPLTVFEHQELQKCLDKSSTFSRERFEEAKGLLERGVVRGLRIVTTGWVWLEGGIGAPWDLRLFQIAEQELLLLSEAYFGSFCDYPALSTPAFNLNRECPTPYAFFADLDDEAPLPPQAILSVHNQDLAFSDWADLTRVSHHRLPDTKETQTFLHSLEDGDLFNLSLAELLDNPMALLKTRTGNLWERP